MAGTVLLVDPLRDQRTPLAQALRRLGFAVSEADDFESAKALLTGAYPDILMTAVQLGPYNGLHLVLRAKAVNVNVRAIVTAAARDRVLQREAAEMGAAYVVKEGEWQNALTALCCAALPPVQHDAGVIRREPG